MRWHVARPPILQTLRFMQLVEECAELQKERKLGEPYGFEMPNRARTLLIADHLVSTGVTSAMRLTPRELVRHELF